MEIEGYRDIITSVVLAKALYDYDRFDIVQKHFSDELCWDSSCVNIYSVMSYIFSGHESYYNEYQQIEHVMFWDDIISKYFTYAWEYGRRKKQPHAQNEYVTQAKHEINALFGGSCCVDWKLLAYVRTKKSAQQSKLLISISGGCGSCELHGVIAYGLIQLHEWFKDKCNEFKAMEETAPTQAPDNAPFFSADLTMPEVKAA